MVASSPSLKPHYVLGHRNCHHNDPHICQYPTYQLGEALSLPFTFLCVSPVVVLFLFLNGDVLLLPLCRLWEHVMVGRREKSEGKETGQ